MKPIVCKFGGSSLADGTNILKVCEILKSDPNRKYAVVSAPGKRYSGDTKVTDLLYENETVTQIYRVTGKNKLHVHAVAASGEEMEALICTVIDQLPGVVSSSCNMILSRIKDIKGLRL